MSVVQLDVVIPTLARPSLPELLRALDRGDGPAPRRVAVVDDRRRRAAPPDLGTLAGKLRDRVRVLRSHGCGPAAARNRGWRACHAPWIVFLDDDVLTPESWLAQLQEDLAELADDVAASQGRIRVPRPLGRPPTDWERNVIALESAPWITADMAYRRSALEHLGGFDERFRRAYREDTDLAIRALRAGYRLERGRRFAAHPIRPAHPLASVRAQAGNADDVLLAALHDTEWRRRAGVVPGRFPRHVAIVIAASVVPVAALRGKHWLAWSSAIAWLAGTVELARARIAPGPRTAREIALMLATSVLIAPAAVLQRLRGHLRVARLTLAARREQHKPPAKPAEKSLRLVLFDRDGTLIVDRPAAHDPQHVQLMPTARRALARLHGRGILAAVVSNQPGLATGALEPCCLARTHARIQQLLGPFAGFFVCPHEPVERCACRKPEPGLLLRAMHTLGAQPHECALIGDIGSDIEAAAAAGVRAVLVPTSVTRVEEIAAARSVAPDLDAAVRVLLRGDA